MFAFSYRQAQSAVLEGIERLHSMHIPTKRPDDYFAEMAKSDIHMKKVMFSIYLVISQTYDTSVYIFKDVSKLLKKVMFVQNLRLRILHVHIYWCY